MNIQTAVTLTGWPTPTTESAMREKRYAQGGMPFSMAAALTGWVTPTSRDWKDSSGMTALRGGKERLDQLPRQAYTCGPLRLTVFGEMRTGSYVEMANGVQLNPAHSRWLMGLPRAWDESSPGWQEWQAATASADSKATVTP
ncbi:cytosine-specific methyltransferase [Salmonella enterica subsp. enterica serovar Enteritidis str. SARB17]|nr:cytosine-specific methyltransferase [Salmonella enterica subsp. enterica serovar Enteritidis str. SARB17]